MEIGAFSATSRTDGFGSAITHRSRTVSVICLLAGPTRLQAVPVIAFQTTISGGAAETMTGTLGAPSLIDVIIGLAGRASTGVAGHALVDTTVGALLVDEECSEGTGATESATVIILGVQTLDFRAGEVVAIGQVVCRGALGTDKGVSAATEVTVTNVTGIGQHTSVYIVNICKIVSALA